MDSEELDDQETTVAEKKKSKQKLKAPNKYQVVFHNDDFTPMEFVVYLLQIIFNHPVYYIQNWFCSPCLLCKLGQH